MKPTPSAPEQRKKRGPKPVQAPPDRPFLVQEWQHLLSWWSVYGRRYNVSALAEDIEQTRPGLLNKSILNKLLSPDGGSAQTAERLDAITAVLSQKYEPLINK